MKIIASVILDKIDLSKQTTLILKLIAVPLILASVILASASNAIADGTHSCQIKVQNNYTETKDTIVYVDTFNGNDKVCLVAHKDYKLAYGESVTAKAHAQGSAKCTLIVETASPGPVYQLCGNLKEGSRCSGGSPTVRVAKKGSLIIHEDGSCTKSE